MLQMALAALLGTMLAVWQSQLPDPFWFGFLPLILLLPWLNRVAQFFLLLGGFYLFASWSCWVLYQQQLDFGPETREFLVEGRVSSLLRQYPQSQRWIFELEADSLAAHAELPRRIQLAAYSRSVDLPLAAGERWRLLVRLKPVRGLWNPAGFDYQRYVLTQGLVVQGYVRASEQNIRLAPASTYSVLYWRDQIRQRLLQADLRAEIRALILALSIGDRSGIDPELRQTLVQTGTMHLLAISGLHIALVASLGWWIGSLLWRLLFWRVLPNRLLWSSLIASVFALAYAALAGFALPTQRALIMLLLAALFLWRRRSLKLIDILSLAMMLILLIDPLAVLGWSFWLSFGALMIIVLSLYRLPPKPAAWQQWLGIQTGFFLLFLPLAALLGTPASISSWLANLLAIPWVSFVVLPLVLLALASTPCLVCQELLLKLAEWSLQLLLLVLQWLEQSIPALNLPQLNTAEFVLLILAMSLLLLVPIKAFRLAAVLMLVLVCWPARPNISPGDWQLHMLDVGQGTSVLIQTARHAVVYDLGPGQSGGFSSGRAVLRPVLRHFHIEQPDRIILSHDDSDHVGGLYAVQDEFAEIEVLAGQAAVSRARFKALKHIQNCHNTKAWQYDGVSFRFISVKPDSSRRKRDNNQSCILKIEGQFHSALLVGDIEADREQILLAQAGPENLRSEVLLVPHHGSNSSSTAAFIAVIQPQLALVSAGFLNRWGFPRAAVVKRYEAQHARLLDTSDQGYWRVESRAQGLTAISAWQSTPYWWRRSYVQQNSP